MPVTDPLRRWLFRLHGPEKAPIVLVQRRVFVLPTPAGLAYAVSLGLMLIGAINYNLSLGYALVFLLTGLGLVTLLHTFRNLVLLEVSPGRTTPVFAGETASFPLLLHNRRRDGRYAIRLRFSGAPPVQTDLAAESITAVPLTFPARRRGWLRPGPVRLETRYPLLLVKAWSYVEPDMQCLVYPAPEASAPPLPFSSAGATGQSGRARGSEDFAGLRNHTPSDSPKQVAWKAVARGHPLLTKQFAGSRPEQLWLDWDELPAGMDSEARLSRLTRWVLEARAAGLLYGLRLPDVVIPVGSGQQHHENCLRALALYGAQER